MIDNDPYGNYPQNNQRQNYQPQNYQPQNYQPQNYQRFDPRDAAIQKEIGDSLNLQLTPEEMSVLKECQHNAVFHRGLPLAAVATGGFHYMMKTGMMKRNIYYLMASGIAGFFVGTVSYRSICMEKLMALPNSNLKERILAAQGVQPVKIDLQSDNQLQPWVDVYPNYDAPKAPMGSALDIEPYQSYNDSYSSPPPSDPESAFALNPPLQPAAGGNYTNYDEMRRRNREEYERTQNQRIGSGGPQQSPPPPSSSAFAPRYDRPSEPTYDPPRRDDFL